MPRAPSSQECTSFQPDTETSMLPPENDNFFIEKALRKFEFSWKS